MAVAVGSYRSRSVTVSRMPATAVSAYLPSPGLVGLNWQRTYRSSLAEQGFNAGLGTGWAHPLSQHLLAQAGTQESSLNYIDEEGRTVYFKHLKVGQSCTNTSEFLTLTRTAETAYRLQASNGLGLAWYLA